MNHEQCRRKVCAICYRKGKRPVAPREVEHIHDNLVDGYSIEDPDFPAALCDGCHLLLSKALSGDEVALPMADNYDPERRRQLRNAESCNCRICKVALATINNPNSGKKKRGRPEANVSDEKACIKICGKCFGRIGQGISHDCTRKNKVYNVERLLSDTPTTSQRVASRIIDATETPYLQTLGPKKKQLTPGVPKKQLFSAESMSQIQIDLGLSNRKTQRLAQDLREASGCRKVIEKGARKEMREKNKELADFFEQNKYNYCIENVKLKTRENFLQVTVICNDIEGLIDKIILRRGLDAGNMLTRIGVDGGGGFLKICMSLFELSAETCERGRGKRLQKRFKDSGVKKVIIIGICPDVPENYFNLKRLRLETGLVNLRRPFTVATDLKLCNILLGLMAHGSCHPCCWCDITKDRLHTVGTSRTIGSLMENFWAFFEANAGKGQAKDYGNVIHQNIFDGSVDPSTLVLIKIPPPELHLMIGPVNKMFDELNKVWPGCESQWMESLHIKREEYHGGSFNGNDCRKLLKNTHILQDKCPSQYGGFVEAFDAFNKVVESCYGMKLEQHFKEHIETFRKSYIKLKISVTPKLHAVFYHVPEFCEMVGKGLSPWSEQTAESLHHDFASIWEHFKIKDLDHPDYGKRLLDAVTTYNSQHL